jgi:hypothetical protein
MLLELILGFVVGAYVESKYATQIGLVISKVVGLVHSIIGLLVTVFNKVKSLFTKKPAPAPVVDPAPVAPAAPADTTTQGQ